MRRSTSLALCMAAGFLVGQGTTLSFVFLGQIKPTTLMYGMFASEWGMLLLLLYVLRRKGL